MKDEERQKGVWEELEGEEWRVKKEERRVSDYWQQRRVKGEEEGEEWRMNQRGEKNELPCGKGP